MRRRTLSALLVAFLMSIPTGTPAAGEEPGRKPGSPAISAEAEGTAPAAVPGSSPPETQIESSAEDSVEPDPFEEKAAPTIADPIEPVNRALYVFNDKAYFWVMKPLAQGYSFFVPQAIRVSVRNAFSNIGTPARFANNLLQGEFRDSGVELLRLLINSTMGIGGLFDAARNIFHIEKKEEDLGLTLGTYRLGHGMYLMLPLLGPSSVRDGLGLAGDAFLDPIKYLGDLEVVLGVQGGKGENELSLSIGDYEDLKKGALDPYIAVRDAYIQRRAKGLER